MKEEWRPVPGWEGVYEVSSFCRVRSLTRQISTCGRSRTFTTRELKGRLLVPTLDRAGYLRVDLKFGRKRKNSLLHRVFAEVFIPNPEGKPHINHKDGVKTNNDSSNLEWCSHKENMGHAFSTGLTPRPKNGSGELSPASKLAAEDVAEIKERLKAGEGGGSIANDYPVSRNAIYEIKAGRSWRAA